ncbi:hypothetical protein IGI04_011952, partial [Brassica rapa subsp. trilocularis]
MPQKSNGKAASASTQSLSFTLLPVLVSFCICQVRVKIVVIEGFTFYQPTDFLSIVATVGLLCVSPTPRNSLQRGNSPFLLNWLPKEFVSVISLKDHQSLISFISTIRLRFVAM